MGSRARVVRGLARAKAGGAWRRSDFVVRGQRRRRDRSCSPCRRGALRHRLGRRDRRPEAVAAARARPRTPSTRALGAVPSGQARGRTWRRCGESDRRDAAVRARRDARRLERRSLRERARVSKLRAKCPDCGGYTAVALGPNYECHVCGREFCAGLVRVPRAWGAGGEAMEAAAFLPLPYPEAAVIAEDSFGEQSLALAAELPERPLVLGGCCCAHVGAVEALESRFGRIAVIWFDAHGDLNTVESSPTGNLRATPLRMLIDSAAVAAEDVALVGARNLDPPEDTFIAETGVRVGADKIAAALDGTEGVYVAFDADSVDPGELEVFMPEPDGLTLDEVESAFRGIRERSLVVGAGFSALAPDPANVAPVTRLAHALGL